MVAGSLNTKCITSTNGEGGNGPRGRNKLISRAYIPKGRAAFRFEIVNSPDVDRPPAGEPSNFHRIRETTTVNARNARSRRGNEACHSSGARNREKFHPLREFLRNFLSPGPDLLPTFFNNACVHATDIYCMRLLYISFRSVNRDINIFANPGTRRELGNWKWLVG